MRSLRLTLRRAVLRPAVLILRSERLEGEDGSLRMRPVSKGEAPN
jgi:hypothetical protein